jgi:four helix bundle protein
LKNFKELKVWQKSHQLTLAVYQITKKFPREELFGLTGQLRRASASIPANIAEGCGRKGEADFARFLQIAAGSASELEYHILLSYEIGLLKMDDYNKLAGSVAEVKRMLTVFIRKLRAES